MQLRSIICAAAFGVAIQPCLADDANLPVTKAAQDALTPTAVLADLAKGNQNFVSGKLSEPNVKARIKAATKGQYPKAYILSCIDSRVPVEQVFDQQLGDIFVGRVAGNIENCDQLGSMEFAAAVSGVKVIMVLGHEACGAVNGACDHVEMGNLTGLLENITPAIKAVKGHDAEGRTSKNEEFVGEVVEQNVRQTVADIRKRSEVLAKLEKEGKIKIVGGVYSLETGAVAVLD
ncbi:MAG: carbonic anhydrase [Verrucomicrobiae bacterium]|nr:carbonic anhydrase [Verrucomicrobiae bacterium]